MAKRLKFQMMLEIELPDAAPDAPVIDVVNAFLSGNTTGLGRAAEQMRQVVRVLPGAKNNVSWKHGVASDIDAMKYDETETKTEPAKAKRAKGKS